MATASKICKEVVVTTEKLQMVTLALSEEEAMFLFDLVRRVGGDPITTRRGYALSIEDALNKIGIVRTDDNRPTDLDGSIWCLELDK